MAQSKLDNIFKELNKKSGFEDVAVRGIDLQQEKPRYIKFPCPQINWCTYGGFRLNKIHQFCGPEGGGKTTTALVAAGIYQKQSDAKAVIYVDTEHAFDPVYTQKLGVDLDNLRVWQPTDNTAEEIFDTCIEFIRSEECGILIVDSIVEMESESDSKKDLDEGFKMGGNAALIGRFCHRATELLKRCDCTVFLINQVRDSMDPYENYTMPGGRRLKHLSGYIYILEKGGLLTDKYELKGKNYESPLAGQTCFYIHKAKTFAPDRRKGTYTINFHNGPDWVYDLFNFACVHGIIDARGAWYFPGHDKDGVVWTDKFDKINGKLAMIQWLRDNPEETQTLWDMCYELCLGGAVSF